jgi:L-2-hydroxyglutarate oxidase LhgO
MDHVECVVAGAGVVGLAIARALALAGRPVLVLEAAEGLCAGTSGRGSGVIHGGLYYPPGSLKARLCVEGRQRLYDYAETHHIPHRRLGKLVVATSTQEDASLADIAATARENGVDDLAPLSAADARALEPALACTSALLSPSTGVVDAPALIRALLDDAEEFGAVTAFRAPLERAFRTKQGFVLDVGGAAPMRLGCSVLVNAAGHGAPALAAAVEGMPPERVPKAAFAKGSYFALRGPSPFTRLIYPLPGEGGLGIHLTAMLDGRVLFGPDVEWIEDLDYSVDAARADAFAADIRRYWPALPDDALVPAGAGVRPKIAAEGEPSRDFVIEGEADHGVAGLVNLFGIESPGLTAALAVAEHVRDLALRF